MYTIGMEMFFYRRHDFFFNLRFILQLIKKKLLIMTPISFSK